MDDIYASPDKIEINGRDVDVEKLANYISELHGSLLATGSQGEILEPLWIAEVLSSWSQDEQGHLTAEAGEHFSSNWKYDRSMRADMSPMLALVAHIREPQLIPDLLTYGQLLHAIDQVVAGPTSIEVVARRLSQQGIVVTTPFLLSILRNEIRYLIIYVKSGICVCQSVDALASWHLAAALFEPQEYLRSSGLGFDGTPYWATSYRTDFRALKAFFNFHQGDIVWSRFDQLEVCLKLSQCHANCSGLTQGIPTEVHRFIVNWIVSHKRVWRTQDSARTLGRTFSFDPENVSPGRLMVYGSSDTGRIGSGALVVREMVSREKQLPGLIHSSRILTPFDEVTINAETHEIESLLLEQTSFKIWGIAHIDDLAVRLLRRRGYGLLPHTLKLARLTCIEALPRDLLQIGRGLLLAQHFIEIVDVDELIDIRLKKIIDHLSSCGVNRRQIPEHLSVRASEALLG
ncbi:MAG: hypothetical protein ACOH1L_03195 [Thermomonas sp.]